ncbi:hypothetical protein [Kitasatospora fiedleri]|uniref:hypothetical protein n=1 Tax=Kitasatospora fiedleri TaxID=2991545 RepID=UPI00249A50AF|nr:hypothetical protein [Kitasatospora fiedleri]
MDTMPATVQVVGAVAQFAVEHRHGTAALIAFTTDGAGTTGYTRLEFTADQLHDLAGLLAAARGADTAAPPAPVIAIPAQTPVVAPPQEDTPTVLRQLYTTLRRRPGAEEIRQALASRGLIDPGLSRSTLQRIRQNFEDDHPELRAERQQPQL